MTKASLGATAAAALLATSAVATSPVPVNPDPQKSPDPSVAEQNTRFDAPELPAKNSLEAVALSHLMATDAQTELAKVSAVQTTAPTE